MFITELIPKCVEFAVVWPMNDVCQLVQHSVDDLLNRKELRSVAGVAETEENLLASVHV